MHFKIPVLRNLKTQTDAFVYFLQKMDIEMIDMILDDGITYQDFEKKKFIGLLSEALNKLSSKGDTFLRDSPGYCNSKTCNFKLKGYLLMGNKLGDYMNFLIETEGNRVLICLNAAHSNVPQSKSYLGKEFLLIPSLSRFNSFL